MVSAESASLGGLVVLVDSADGDSTILVSSGMSSSPEVDIVAPFASVWINKMLSTHVNDP